MEHTRERELREAATPLIKYLNKNWNPHVMALVNTNGVEILSGERVIHTDEKGNLREATPADSEGEG